MTTNANADDITTTVRGDDDGVLAAAVHAAEERENIAAGAWSTLHRERRAIEAQIKRLSEALARSRADLAAWDERHLDELIALKQAAEAAIRDATVARHELAFARHAGVLAPPPTDPAA